MTVKFNVVLVFGAGFLLAASVQAHAQTEPSLLSCSKIESDSERLSCYDRLVNEIYGTGKAHTDSHAKVLYIQPPQEFLASELRVDPAKSDFDLTIQQFIELIKSAKLENGQPVVIDGWSMQDQGFVLNIQMKSPVQLLFEFGPQHNEYSVLQPVSVKGAKVDAALFVMNMAARTM